MTRFVDTTLRLLSQDPLARTLSSADILALAEGLDTAGYSALEVSGGGCFTTAVERAWTEDELSQLDRHLRELYGFHADLAHFAIIGTCSACTAADEVVQAT